MSTSIRDEPILRVVGRYELLREVGRGGTAIVYVARQRDLGRHVALKELAAFHAAKPVVVERFLRESRVTGALNHPNVVTVHEYLEHEGTAFIAMEYFERGSVRPWVAGLELPQIAGVLEGVLAGLAHAEEHGIVHRDLKPENLMVTSAGGIKITDFGIAKALQISGVESLTAAGTTVGTPAYMAPEQALGTAIGPWTDLYAVGVMAYEMLSGDVPFRDGELPLVTLLQHANEPVPPLRDVDPGLSRWVERLLAKKPADRPASARDAWEELEEVVIGILGPRWRRDGQLAGDPTTIETRPMAHAGAEAGTVPLPRRRRRARWLAAGVTAALLAAAGVAALAHGTGGSTPRPQRPLADFVPAPSEQLALAVAGPSLVIAEPNGRIVQLDRASLRVQRVVHDPARPRGVAVSGGRVYIADSEGVTARGPALGPLGAVPLRDARALAAGGSVVVANRSGRVCELDGGARMCGRVGFAPTGVGASASGELVAAADGRGGAVTMLRRAGKRLVPAGRAVRLPRPHGELIFFRGRAYVATERGIAIVDPVNATATRIRLPVSPAAIWIGRGGLLYAALPATGRLAIIDTARPQSPPRMVAVGGKPVALAGTARTLFVADRLGRITKLDARTGARRASVRLRAPAARPPKSVVLSRVGARRNGGATIVTLTLAGGRLDPDGLVIRDGAIKDGRAAFELWQGGIRTAARARSFGDLAVRVSRQTGRLVVRLATPAGTFEKFRIRPAGARLVVELRKPSKAAPARPPTGPTGSTGQGRSQPNHQQQKPKGTDCCNVG